VKKFDEHLWSKDDINSYTNKNSVLVLFKIYIMARTVDVIIHGKLNDKQKFLLKVCILGEFGKKNMSEGLSIKINEYARNWYGEFIKPSGKVRVLNFGRKEV